MSRIIHHVILLGLCLSCLDLLAQTTIKGKVIDAVTKEPVQGASLHCMDAGCNCGCATNALGEFEMSCRDCSHFSVSYIGYSEKKLALSEAAGIISLNPATSIMHEVVITANRGEAVKRSQAPIAITTLTTRTIHETKPTSADQLLNKISGVNMVSLGNEQHQMSIRQPMTTKSLFLYLEDGIPVRTTGLFNHNALLEMNMAVVKNIEVIKGPSSSLYGSEAIGGVVNFITHAPTSVPVLKLSAQGNTIGYKRADINTSFSKNKLGVVLAGYYADKRNGYMDYSDFHKGTLTARVDYRFSQATSISSRLSLINYYTDMPGSVDSTMFATRKFSNPQTFTYRKVNAVRYNSTLSHSWKTGSKTTASLVYRINSIGQNPAYRIRDDYRKTGTTWTGKKDLAHGEINESKFNSYAIVAQHRQNFKTRNAVFLGGISLDLSPSTYQAHYIRIKKDTITKKYLDYQDTDSVLTNYQTGINNYAAFANFEFDLMKKLRLVASLRYDLFRYDFNNHLKPSSFSGAADTVNHFSRISPKIGFTWSLSTNTGIYANYSQGFVPPQVTEMYTGVKVPDLIPSVFYNYEIGGWAELVKNKLTADISFYRLKGTNEVVSVKMEDGSSENRNAGETLHNGLEFGFNAKPVNDISLRLSGAFSRHKFIDFIEKGNNYNGKEMNGAPHWMHHAEVWYRPSFLKGLRLGAEWQRIGRYYMDPKNTTSYRGYHVLNLRAGYEYNGAEIWLHVLNATDNYYSQISTRTSSGYSYQLAEPRSFALGLSYDFGGLLKK